MRVLWEKLTSEEATRVLEAAGLRLDGAVVVEPRDQRWLVRLPENRLAFFAASEAGRGRLVRERRVLRLVREHCSFEVPRVLLESDDGGLDVRAVVVGRVDPWPLYERVLHDSEFARRTGEAFGHLLAEQHRIPTEPLRDWLPQRPAWPESPSWILDRVRQVVDERDLLVGIEECLTEYQALNPSPQDRVLVHSDLGLHNSVFDPDTLEVRGVFDYDDAAWADRHYDFRYLLFDIGSDDMLDAALSVYQGDVGRQLSRARIALYNAACACSFLAFRLGKAPEEDSCGRTLAEDLRWCRHALARYRDWSRGN